VRPMTKVKNLEVLLPLLLIFVLITGVTSLDAFAAIFFLYSWKKMDELKADEFLKKDLSFLFWFLPLSLFVAHLFKHWSFHTHGWDMSFLHQPLFYPFKPHLLHNDLSINNTFLGEHLSFTFFPLGLFLQYWQNDYVIFVLHTLCLFGGVWALVRFGPTKKSTLPFWVFLLFLFTSKTFRAAFIFDFREDSLAFLGLCGLFLSVYFENLFGYFLCLLWTVLSKENYSLICLFLVFPLFFDQKIKKKWAFVFLTLLVCLSWAFISFKVLIPHFTAGIEKAHPIASRFGDFGANPREILFNLLTKPANWWILLNRYLLTWSRVKYLLYLIIPYIFYSRKHWVWMIPALPGIAMNLFSSSATQVMMSFHYDLMILPFLIYPFLLGIAEEKKSKNVLLALCLALSFSGKWPLHFVIKYWPGLDDIANTQYLENLPQKNITAANLTVLAHLNRLENFRILKTEKADWESFLQSNLEPDPRSKLKAFEASHFVLDLSLANEKKIYEVLLNQSWKVESSSPDGRFQYLKKP
jgi:uncharacterized membrane protein